MGKITLKPGISRLCGYWQEAGADEAPRHQHNLHILQAGNDDDENRRLKFGMLHSGALSNTLNAFIPHCPSCPASQYCRPLRLNLKEFYLSPSQQRKTDAYLHDMDFSVSAAKFDMEHFRLYNDYVVKRHGTTQTDLKNLTPESFKENFLNHIRWQIVSQDKRTGKTASICYVDQHERDYSLEYICYDLERMKQSPGISSILCLSNVLKNMGEDYLYLGSWSPGSDKIDYKKQFRGAEIHTNEGWVALDKDSHSIAPPGVGYSRVLGLIKTL